MDETIKKWFSAGSTLDKPLFKSRLNREPTKYLYLYKLVIWYLLVQAPSKKVTSSTAIYPLTRELPHTPSKTTCKIIFSLHWSKLLKNLKWTFWILNWEFSKVLASKSKIEIGPVSFLTLIFYISKCAIKIW